MSLNATPSAERIRIGFFGLRNAGKSSLVNALAGQDLAVVSDTPGTTTDLVSKAMELLPAGPVSLVDTPGLDDVGELGALRVDRAQRALRACDVAVVVAQAGRELTVEERGLVELFRQKGLSYVIAWNKADLPASFDFEAGEDGVVVSAVTGEGVLELKERLAALSVAVEKGRRLLADLVDAGDAVVLVMPIDSSAPKGRIILPQQMALRDALDAHARVACCQPEELAETLAQLAVPPRLVVTDSQVFAAVAKVVPEEVALTSFSILMARYKGTLSGQVRAARAIDGLADGDRVLVSEGCTHHRQCEDIGTVKIPRWVRERSGAQPVFEFTSGASFPDDLSGYALVIHCGGCMLNDREMAHRADAACDAGVPFVNYGVAIAHMNGILERSLKPLA